MASRTDLVTEADRAFAKTGGGLQAWPDPHSDRAPRDDEYSRVADAAKWRTVGARAQAWLDVIETLGLARIDRDASVRWVAEPGTRIATVTRATPRRPGALPLVVARSAIGDVDDAGLTFGVGDPATCVTWIPSCGCDACDSGSQNELDQVDQLVLGVISGSFRRLESGDRVITRTPGRVSLARLV